MAQDCRRQHFANSGHQGVVCLMLEEDCSSSFVPSKMLGADEAAVFVVAVVVMVLSFDNMMLISGAQKRWRRGGRFLEHQACDEDGADEDGEDEQDAAAAAQEAAEERVAALEKENSTLRSLNERLDGEVSALRDQRELAEAALELASHHPGDQLRDHAQQAVERLEGVNQEVLGQREEEQRQRIVSERATQTQREAHRNEVPALQRRQQEELASERQQRQEILAQGREPLATSNSDNAVLAEQAAAAERRGIARWEGNDRNRAAGSADVQLGRHPGFCNPKQHKKVGRGNVDRGLGHWTAYRMV
ncbi:unnamed protein product [Ectocarpus sp. 6 AP-2014]